MTLNTLGWAAACAFVFSLWPLVSKVSGLHSTWVALLVLIGSLIGGGIPSMLKISELQAPSFFLVVLFLILGALNGLGMFIYPIKLNDPSVATGPYVVTVMMGIVLMSLVLGALLFWELPTLRQCAGALAALIAIWLLAG